MHRKALFRPDRNVRCRMGVKSHSPGIRIMVYYMDINLWVIQTEKSEKIARFTLQPWRRQEK